MILDNLFSTLGGVGTAGVLIGILGMLFVPAMRSVACPTTGLRRSFQRSL
jgi:hypothetical protein